MSLRIWAWVWKMKMLPNQPLQWVIATTEVKHAGATCATKSSRQRYEMSASACVETCWNPLREVTTQSRFSSVHTAAAGSLVSTRIWPHSTSLPTLVQILSQIQGQKQSQIAFWIICPQISGSIAGMVWIFCMENGPGFDMSTSDWRRGGRAYGILGGPILPGLVCEHNDMLLTVIILRCRLQWEFISACIPNQEWMKILNLIWCTNWHWVHIIQVPLREPEEPAAKLDTGGLIGLDWPRYQ